MAAVQPMAERRELSDRLLIESIIERQMPVLAIGLGMQQINTLMGGTLFLHLPIDHPKSMPHFDPSGGPHRHIVLLEPNTRIEEIYGDGELRVNSRHHQAVNVVSPPARGGPLPGRRHRVARGRRSQLVLHGRAVAPGGRHRLGARHATVRVLHPGDGPAVGSAATRRLVHGTNKTCGCAINRDKAQPRRAYAAPLAKTCAVRNFHQVRLYCPLDFHDHRTLVHRPGERLGGRRGGRGTR